MSDPSTVSGLYYNSQFEHRKAICDILHSRINEQFRWLNGSTAVRIRDRNQQKYDRGRVVATQNGKVIASIGLVGQHKSDFAVIALDERLEVGDGLTQIVLQGPLVFRELLFVPADSE